jgi:UDP-N-acetylmuramoyl-tripeptide--D-alanyl-D-alanine ligase
LKLSDAANFARASTEASGAFFDKEIENFSIDSRSVGPGDIFFALSPEDYRRHCFTATSFADAHRFIPQAFAQGAVAAFARRARIEGDEELAPYRDRLLLVEDVIEALQRVARGAIERWGRPVVGVTGSAGKTTTKDLIAHVLGVSGRRVLRSLKNYNNELGVALSVLQMESGGRSPSDFDAAVLEMGMSVPGEIAVHCRVAPPDVGVVTVVSPVHLEFMGSIERIAEGKAQLVEGTKPGGIAVLNADDERVAAMRAKAKHLARVVTYGVSNKADVMASRIERAGLSLTRFRLRTPEGELDAELPMPGQHNLLNALAAAAVASSFGVGPREIAEALRTAAPSRMRGEVLDFEAGFTIIDDSYNSNPLSLVAMAEALAAGGEGVRRRIIVAGEMLELGPESAAIHRETGRDIAGLGVDLIWGVRGDARELIEGAREAGMSEEATRYYESSEEAAGALAEIVRPGDLVLVKGSRGVHTERVIERVKELWPESPGPVSAKEGL